MTKQDKIFDLLNKAIDGVLTAGEEAKLKKYLETHPEAQTLYDDMKRVTMMLDDVKEIEPPASLRQRIVNAFGSQTPPLRSKEGFIGRWNLSHFIRYRVAYAFAGGVVAGLLVFGIFIERIVHDAPLDVTKLYGTLVDRDYAAKMKNCDRVSLDIAGISGNINTKRSENIVLADIAVESGEAIELEVTFDKRTLRVLGIGQPEGSGSPLKITGETILINAVGKNRYNIFFIDQAQVPAHIKFLISKSGNVISEYQLKMESSR